MKNYPVIKLVAAFICGCLLQNYLDFNLPLLISISLILCAAILCLLIKKNKNLSLLNYLVYPLLISVSALYFALHSYQKTCYPFSEPVIRKVKIVCEICDIKLIQDKKIQFIVAADSVNNMVLEKNRFLCSVNDTSEFNRRLLYEIIGIGNRLEIEGTIREGRGERNPGEFDYQKYIENNGISGIIYCNDIYSVNIVDRKLSWPGDFIFKTRKIIDQNIRALNNKDAASLLRGLMLADRSLIEPEVKENFINSGVIHVLAVSGLHVGIIAVIFIFLSARLNLFFRNSFIIIGLLGFLVLTGSPASVFRAIVMAIVIITANLTGRCRNNYNNLSIAAMVLLLLNPAELFNPGFQLSFSAVLSIIVFQPYFKNKINEFNVRYSWIKQFLLFVSVSLSAFIGTLPFTLVYFEKLSLVSLLANLVVIPLIGVILPLAFVTLFSSVFSFWIASVFAATNNFLIETLFKIIDTIGGLEISHINIYGFTIYDIIVFYLTLILIAYAVVKIKGVRQRLILLFFLILNASVLISLDNKSFLPEGKIAIIAIDVGQGDSFLIRFPDKTAALIDAGEADDKWDNGEMVILPLLKRLGIGQVENAFISHMDSDHYAGFEYLIKAEIIKKIYKPAVDTALIHDIVFEELLRARNVPFEYYKTGCLETGGAKMYFLNGNKISEKYSWDINNRSGIIKLVFGNTAFLFTGDAGTPVEKYLMNRYGEFLKTDVLKVSHHGSKTGTSKRFLEVVNPKLAVISAGVGNKFRHPSDETINRLQNSTIKILRTDIEGAVVLTSNGENIVVLSWRDRN